MEISKTHPSVERRLQELEKKIDVIDQVVKDHSVQLETLETDSLLMKESQSLLITKFETLKNSIQKSFTRRFLEIGVSTMVILLLFYNLYNIINSILK
jgi:uncharacterized coiled-coil protein SlyX